MAQLIKQANIFGRIGTGIGKGLAEQAPKEIERNRLASGLKAIGENPNLTPTQRFVELASVAHEYPQLIESGSKVFGKEAQRQNFSRKAGELPGERIQAGQGLSNAKLNDVQFANLKGQNQPERGVQTPAVLPEDFGQPQVVNRNPLRPEAQDKLPWTPQQRDSDTSRVWNDNPDLTFEQAREISANNESRDLARPAVERAQDANLRAVQDLAQDKFKKSLETKLQKTGTGTYADISGEMQNNLIRGMERDLRSNPQATVDDVVNDWTNRALDLAKTKGQLNELASSRTWFDKIAKPQENYEKLKSAQKIFEKAGNNEEFYNILRRAETDKSTGFNMSPQGAALIAYPRSKRIAEYISSSKVTPHQPGLMATDSRKKAIDIEDLLTSSDSLLSITKAFKMHDPSFNERDFFSQLREDQDQIGLNPRQRRELITGESDIFPDWGDLWTIPPNKGYYK